MMEEFFNKIRAKTEKAGSTQIKERHKVRKDSIIRKKAKQKGN